MTAAAAAAPMMVSLFKEAPTPDGPISLCTNDVIAVPTPCLEVQPAPVSPGGATRVLPSTHQTVKAFLPRNKISRTPADLAATSAAHLLTTRLTDAGGSHIPTELRSAQTFTIIANTLDQLHNNPKHAPLNNPANLDLLAGDWCASEALAIPGGAGTAAIAAQTSLRPIRFLTLLSVATAEEASAPFPLSLLGATVGPLGPCLAQAAQRAEAATVQPAPASPRPHLTAAAPTDCPWAVETIPLPKSEVLPSQPHSWGVTGAEQREEREDDIEYGRSDRGELAVEEKRIYPLGTRYAHAQLLAP